MEKIHAIRQCKKCHKIRPLVEFPYYDRGQGRRRHECIECNRIRVESHHKKNKERRLKRARERYAQNPSKYWSSEQIERAKCLARQKNAELRNIVIKRYGGVCVCCGEAEPKFLTMDHVENNGQHMRKNVHGTGVAVYRWIINAYRY